MGLLSRRDEDFTAFVEQHGDALLRAAHFLTGDRWAAEDLVQLALTKTYLAWPTARGNVPYAYARQALLSCHTDTWRRRRWREDTTAPEDLPGHSSGHADSTRAYSDPAHAVAQRDGMEQALARLTPRERAVVVLRYLEDLTEKDTARLLNVSVGTVKTLHSRAMTRLRNELEGEPPNTRTAERLSPSPPTHNADGVEIHADVEIIGRRSGTTPPASSSSRRDTSCVDQ